MTQGEGDSTSGARQDERPAFKPPYPGWAPYCLVCPTISRMRATSFGWQCRSCGNQIGKDLTHWNGEQTGS